MNMTFSTANTLRHCDSNTLDICLFNNYATISSAPLIWYKGILRAWTKGVLRVQIVLSTSTQTFHVLHRSLKWMFKCVCACTHI